MRTSVRSRCFSPRVVLAALVAVLSGACSSEEQPTEILLSISEMPAPKESIAETLTLRVRAYQTEPDDADVRDEISDIELSTDITQQPFQILIRPSERLPGELPADWTQEQRDEYRATYGDLFLHVQGFRKGSNVPVCAQSRFLTFVDKQRSEQQLLLDPNFIDQDGDGFSPKGEGPLKDCLDVNADAMPFQKEICDPQKVDNNCVGSAYDGCPCINGEKMAWTNLPPEQQHLAGVGGCTFGSLVCIDEVWVVETQPGPLPSAEVADFIDNDCNGSVDENIECEVGTPPRRCFMGYVDDPANPNENERLGASKRAVGECAPPGTQSCEANGRWGRCLNMKPLPQRGTDGVGFIELETQCDGKDNDCDGSYDEESYFDGDSDGYTYCGSIFTGLEPPEAHAEPGIDEAFIDCADNDNTRNPGLVEMCGNTKDEDCRCDHDPWNRPVTDAASVIGLPANHCAPQLAALSCGTLPRSDANPTGNCQDSADGLPSYWWGFNDFANGACVACVGSFGVTCSADGNCSTKEEDCNPCPQTTPGASAPKQERPLCKRGVAGTCAGSVPPAWELITDADPFQDCPGVSCEGFYWGRQGAQNEDCFEVRALSDDEVSCAGDAGCDGASVQLCCQPPTELCLPSMGPKAAPIDAPLCKKVVGGCYGTTPPEWGNQTAGEDLYFDCNEKHKCGPDAPVQDRYYLLQGDPVQCYYRDDVDDNACDGNGVCRTQAQACLAMTTGSRLLPHPSKCKIPTDCDGNTGPSWTTPVTPYHDDKDPYNECAGTGCCLNGCCLDNGAQCTNNDECKTGFCVDGVCCATDCAAACYSCKGTDTGENDGVCAAINSQTTDPGKCLNTTGCTGGVGCICARNLGRCRSDNGQICGVDDDCASGNCSADFDSGTNYCAPSNTCANNAVFYTTGDELCNGNTYYKSCTSEGVWGAQQNNPDSDNSYCDAGGGAQSGYDLAETCTSGTTGGFSNNTCHSCSPYNASSTSSCFLNCNTNDDSKCWSGYHCLASDNRCYSNAINGPCDLDSECTSGRCEGTCLAKLDSGGVCDEASDCSSGNCSADFDSTTNYCAPVDTCADNATSYAVGYELCSGNSYYKTCTSEGVWSAQVNSPDAANNYCNPTGVTNGGYDPMATCTSGATGGFTDPGCFSCSPYYASSTSSCSNSCATDDNSRCWTGYHCAASDNHCYNNSNGSLCDIDGECASGRCDSSCMAKLGNTEVCDEDSDCVSGRCDGTCMDKVADGQPCDEPSDCTNGNCSADFDSSQNYCAPATKCAHENTFYDVTYRLCSGNAFYKTCTSAGVWSSQANSPDTADDFCNAGGGTNSGYDLAATCASGLGTSFGFANPGCTSCSPYFAATTSSCSNTCATNDNAKCWSGYHCLAADDKCYANADGNACDVNGECTSGNCSTDFDSATKYCAEAGHCAHEVASYELNYRLCSGNTYYKECTAAGTWTQVNSPDAANDYCDAGGGANSGYDLAATCASGQGTSFGFTNPGCTSCSPYFAVTTSSCSNSCAPNDNAKCWSGNHCLAADDKCHANADGSACDVNGECTSGNCSTDFDSATKYCAEAGHCAHEVVSHELNYRLCSGNSYYKECTAAGTWTQVNSPDAANDYCDAGGGANSGYDLAATCTNGVGFTDPSCASCNPYFASSTSTCSNSCATNDDAKCWTSYHCASTNNQCYNNSNGSACDLDSECASGRCDGTCMDKLQNGGTVCDEASDCVSGQCDTNSAGETGRCCAVGAQCCDDDADCTGTDKCVTSIDGATPLYHCYTGAVGQPCDVNGDCTSNNCNETSDTCN